MIYSRRKIMTSMATAFSISCLTLGAPMATAASGQNTERAEAMKAWEDFLANQNQNGNNLPGSEAFAQDGPGVQSDLTDRTTAASPQILKGDLSSNWSSMLAVMFGGFGLMAALGLRNKTPQIANWLATRAPNQQPHSPKKSAAVAAAASALPMDDQVSIVAVKPLGNKNKLAIVKVFDKKLVLGLSSDQVTLMTDYDELTQDETRTATAEQSENPFDQIVEEFFNDESLPTAKTEAKRPTAETPPAPVGRNTQARPATASAPNLGNAKRQSAPPTEAVGAALRDALNRKQNTRAAQTAPGLTHGKRLTREMNPPPVATGNALQNRRKQIRIGSGSTWNNTVSGSPAQRYAANAQKTPSSPAAGNPSDSATDQVLRKIQTMRRFR